MIGLGHPLQLAEHHPPQVQADDDVLALLDVVLPGDGARTAGGRLPVHPAQFVSGHPGAEGFELHAHAQQAGGVDADICGVLFLSL